VRLTASKATWAAAAASIILTGVVALLPSLPARSSPGKPSTATPPPGAGRTQISGDAKHGAALYAAKCAGCHGAQGAGSVVAPALKTLKTRRGTEAAIVWIKDPQPPMPKLYPKSLSDNDVNDIVAYLESL
jgi:mono/diheme cytochrome c family protein